VNPVVLIAAMLSGLCAEALATPISFDRIEPLPINLVINPAEPIQGDFSLHSTDEDSLFDQTPDDPDTELIATDLDPGLSAHEASLLYAAGNQISTTGLRAPEPPALALIILGLGCLTLCGMIKMIAPALQQRGEDAQPLRRRRVRQPRPSPSDPVMARW
jgi:hypothetical protein